MPHLFIYLSIDEHLGRIQLLVIVNNAVTNKVHEHLFESLFSIFFVYIPGSGISRSLNFYF